MRSPSTCDLSKPIQQYWDAEAHRLAPDAISTHRDRHQSRLEVDALAARLAHRTHRGRLLEIGCGNGYAMDHFADRFRVCVGVDYSHTFLRNVHPRHRRCQSSAVVLPFKNAVFDVVLSKRCLINLPSWTLQRDAIIDVHRVLKPHGTFLMLEATQQGYDALNHLRELVGLAPIAVVWHNHPLDEAQLNRLIAEYFHVRIRERILNLYYFISRIVHPLLVAPYEPGYDAHINTVARHLETLVDLPLDVSPLILYELVKL